MKIALARREERRAARWSSAVLRPSRARMALADGVVLDEQTFWLLRFQVVKAVLEGLLDHHDRRLSTKRCAKVLGAVTVV